MTNEDLFMQERDERVRTRIINGEEYTTQCSDPYGFWTIKGKQPAELSGNFTSQNEVWRAITNYYENLRLKQEEKNFIVGSDGKGGKTKIKLIDTN